MTNCNSQPPSAWIELDDNESRPRERQMVVLIAKDVDIGTPRTYTSDPYCGWLNRDGTFSRWPHSFQPTHYMEIPEV